MLFASFLPQLIEQSAATSARALPCSALNMQVRSVGVSARLIIRNVGSVPDPSLVPAPTKNMLRGAVSSWAQAVTDVVVIGAGAIGLACAAQLAARNLSVLVLERHQHFGTETSSRNSEVIHAGIYYTPESLKARYCVEGNALMYDFCRQHDVPHKRTGKLIVEVP